ncbi:hypothetical protein ACI8AC_18410 [Geodermatophilus sp. SYSU D00758]
MTAPSRRSLLATVAVVAGLALQLVNLLDVFDGAPTSVWITVFAVQALVLADVLVVAYSNVRDARARRRR